ncbi:MAG: FAD-dependent oxidoreductase [Chloroflexota bacterium]
MLGLYGEYDVVVAGAGIAGTVAALAAAREGAKTLLVEEGGFVGGMVTGGRLTKPHGVVEEGSLYFELLKRAEKMGGADTTTMRTSWGEFTGIFDPEIIQRAILDALDEAKVEMLLHARVTDAVVDQNKRAKGLEVSVKSGRRLVLAPVIIDATGDGDVATLAGAEVLLGRPSDGKMQPMTSYMRVLDVDTPRFAAFMREHPEEFTEYVLPQKASNRREDYTFRLHATGFHSLIKQAKAAGEWDVPKDHVTAKAGMLPGEMNFNASRVHGNALDERELTQAELALRRQSYTIFNFFKNYVPGFEESAIMDIASRIGVRETRRVVGDYLLTAADVQSEHKFEDAIGLSRSGIDIHDPTGDKLFQTSIGRGYGIPYRCLLAKGIEGLLVAGRCISSADEVSYGSVRQTPACGTTGEAAGTAAALAVRSGVSPRRVDVASVQAILASRGIPLGNAVPIPAPVVEAQKRKQEA